eukprot:TRINITY_DN73737_c0_g1_i1.p2 TRINITY_DN73737_c0_g1~~TRINITY_DN73737_c0_g1_i1.p2  ORF type:complete len:142 (-),score=50.86 TRINITY_DN73737_c0_g1_i1:25-450(-)
MAKGPKNKGKAKKKVKAVGSVRKAQLKQKKRQVSKDADDSMGGAVRRRETAHELFRRHAAENRKLKSEVAELKKQRAKLPKKGKKEEKKALSARILKLGEDLRSRHAAELEAAGLDKAARAAAGAQSGSEDAGSGDEDEDI